MISFSCFYYHLRWKPFTRLRLINSTNPFQEYTKTKKPPNTTNINQNSDTTKYSLSIEPRDEKENEFEFKYDDDTSSERKTIKILTQNLWVHYLAPSPTKKSRLKAFVQFLKQKPNNYDILIIQEIFVLRFGFCVRCNDLEYLVKELYKIGYINYSKPSGYLPYFGQNGGVLLFSKYPFIYDDVFKFQKSDEIMLRKGFAIGVIQIKKQISLTHEKNEEEERYYHLCVGTAHCDPYRPNIILSQMEQFSQQINSVYNDHKQKLNTTAIDIIVGGDFNTRIPALTKGLHEYFETLLSMYNVWSIQGTDKKQWNSDHVTYRGSYIPKYKIWLAILSCGVYKLPTLSEMTGKYANGYCLDHILTNINKDLIESTSVVDTRFQDVFVSDHLGVELVIRLPE